MTGLEDGPGLSAAAPACREAEAASFRRRQVVHYRLDGYGDPPGLSSEAQSAKEEVDRLFQKKYTANLQYK